MKKLLSVLLAITIIFASTTFSFGATTVSVTLNNNQINFTDASGYPFIDANGRTQVPLRQTMETAGFSVSWNAIEKIASVSDNDGTKVHVRIGDDYITKETISGGIVESSRIKNDTYAQIVNNRTFLPIRIVLEAFGASVAWDGLAKRVIVNTDGTTSRELTAEQIYSKFSSAIFYIGLYDNNGNQVGSGSGFFISSTGHAITNYHVIAGASSAKITTPDGTTYDVEGVLDYNKTYDIAKIKVRGSNFPYLNIPQNLPVVSGGNIVYAIGSPLGLDNTISEGIISNPNRTIDGIAYLQITTPISPGSSGGALFDKYGNVIGITSGGFADGQNLNVAIPISNIFTLKNTTLSSLKTLLPQPTFTPTSLLVSKSEINLYVGENDYVVVTADTDKGVILEYHLGDGKTAAAEWGDWYGDSINLYINALNEGVTTIYVTMYEEETGIFLDAKYITVKVQPKTNSYYYSGFYPALDFGKAIGVPIYYQYNSTLGTTFYYSAYDLDRADPNTNFIEYYSAALLKNGFTYTGEFMNKYGYWVMSYNNISYGINVYTYTDTSLGALCYVVMVLWD